MAKMYTPAGIAMYPWITRADTKFNPDGDFRTILRIPAEEAAPMIAELEAFYETVKAEESKKLAKGKKLKEADMPWTPALDDDGNETGEIDFKFKTKAKIEVKKQLIDKVIPLVDAFGKRITDPIAIYGGSKIRVSFTPKGFNTVVGVGVTLRLEGVQVIDLVSGDSGGDGGFGAYEGGGYSAQEAEEPSGQPNAGDDDDNF